MTEHPDLSISIIGRDEELRFVEICLRRRLNCLVVGPVGVGKSTLLRYVVELAPSIDKRFRTSLVDCSAMASPDELVHHLLRQLIVDWNVPLASEIPPESLWEHFRRVLERRDFLPLVCLDSLDFLPDSTLAALARPLVHLTESDSVVFAAARNTLPPLPSWLVNRFQTLYVGPLPADAVLEAIRQHFGASATALHPDVTKKIADISGGHPLILKLILDSLSASESPIDARLSALESRLRAAPSMAEAQRRLSPGQWALKSSKVNETIVNALTEKN